MFTQKCAKLIKLYEVNRFLCSEYFQFTSKIFVAKFRFTHSAKTDWSNNEVRDVMSPFWFKRDKFVFKKYLDSNPNYDDLVWKEKPLEEISNNGEAFELLKNVDPAEEIDEEKYKKLADAINPILPQLSNNELSDLLYLFLKTKYKDFKADNTIISTLDNELMNRFYSFSFNEKFKFLDLLYQNRSKKNFKTYGSSIWKIFEKCNQLNPQQILMLTYLFPKINWTQRNKPFKLENRIFSLLSQFSWFEIGIICHSLLKIHRSFTHEQFIPCFVQKILDDIDNIDSLSFKYICSIIMESCKINQFAHVEEFQKQMISHVTKFKAPSIVYLLLSNIKLNYINMTLAEKGFNIIKNNLDELYFKEIEHVIYLMGRFRIKDDELINSAVKLYESNLDKLQPYYVFNFLACVLPHNIYPENLLKGIVKPEIVKQLVKGKNSEYSQNLIKVYYTMEIFKPGYLMELDELTRRKFWSRITYYKSNSSYKKQYYSIYFLLEKDLMTLYGEKLTVFVQPLTHHLPYLIMKFDKNLQPQPIPEEYLSNKKKGYLCKAPNDGHYWLVFVCIPRSKLFLNTNENNLFLESKISQLKATGYTPICILTKDYLLNNTEKQDLLKQLIENTLKELPQQHLAQNQLE